MHPFLFKSSNVMFPLVNLLARISNINEAINLYICMNCIKRMNSRLER